MLDLAWPMVFGMLSVILFNVVDTIYVGRLGTHQLAAMSFTFPVVFLVMSIAMGMGVGVTSVISRVIGQGDPAQVRRLTTDGLFLANTIVVLVAIGGLLTIAPLFGAMGAGPDIVDLIRRYMVPWYAGIGFIVIPMVGNSAIRATGDTRTPSLIMIMAGGLNIVLDPLLIFGPGPFPRLELQGAAVATVFAYSMTFVASLWILSRRERMIDFSRPRFADVLQSWRRILYVGVPAAGTNMLIPLAAGILTRMVSGFGAVAVASYGAGTRVEGLSMIGIHALFSALSPFVGQNFGAGKHDRVRQALRFTTRVALGYGLAMAALLAVLARPIGSLFNSDPDVVTGIAHYLRIVPVSYGFLGAMFLVNSMFNAVNLPLRSAMLIVLRLFVLAVPLAWVGSRIYGVNGLFGGIAAANVLVGITAYGVSRRFLALLGVRGG
jgi:putative MATE family efflux protein